MQDEFHDKDRKSNKTQKAKDAIREAVQDARPAVDEIKGDLDSLKTNVIGLARSLRGASSEKAHEAAIYVRDRVDELKLSGAGSLEDVEKRIKAKPGQSVAIAFACGIIASYVLGRRS